MADSSQELIDLAHLLANAAGQVARQYYRQDFEIIAKQDETPVTIADRTIETRLREIIHRHRPDDTIIGEEFGTAEGNSGYTWVLDPIDGTKSFTIGRPTFGTLIGLCKNGIPIMGVIDQPISNERWIGFQGRPTTFNGKEVGSKKCPDLKKAIFGTGSPLQISRNDTDRFARIEAACRYTVFQGDCYFYGLMANGVIDVLVEDHLGTYDYIALVPIIEGAGGKITDWSGNNLTLASGTDLVAVGDPSQLQPLLKLINHKN